MRADSHYSFVSLQIAVCKVTSSLQEMSLSHVRTSRKKRSSLWRSNNEFLGVGAEIDMGGNKELTNDSLMQSKSDEVR